MNSKKRKTWSVREAIQTLKEAQRILSESGNGRSDYSLRITESYHALGKKDCTDLYLKAFLNGTKTLRETDKLRFVRLLSKSRNSKIPEEVFQTITAKGDSYFLSD